MDRRAQITATPLHVPSILVVLDPAWPALFSLCLTVAPRCGVLLHRCDAATVATIAAERRPLAIVASNSVYASDPAELDALARDVRATLLRLDEEVTERELEAMLNGALRETAGKRDETGGRYTLIGEQRSETVADASAARRPALRGAAGAEPRSAPRRSETPSPSTLPPPSWRAGAPASVRTPSSSRSLTPVPPSVAPTSARAPSSSRSVTPAPSSVAPPSLRSSSAYSMSGGTLASPRPMSSLPPRQAAMAAGDGGRLSNPPSSVRAAPASARAGALSSPPPSARTLPSTPPPSSRSLHGGPPSSSRVSPSVLPPPSVRSGPPSSARALPSPPSVHSLSSSHSSARPTPTLRVEGTESPPSLRSVGPLSARMAPPSRTDPIPRSGVRERGCEELDAVFEDQNLPLDALARGNRSTTPS